MDFPDMDTYKRGKHFIVIYHLFVLIENKMVLHQTKKRQRLVMIAL